MIDVLSSVRRAAIRPIRGLALAILVLVGVDQAIGGADPAPIRCVVSIPPLAGLAGPLVEAADGTIETVIPVGASPHGWEMPPSAIASIRTADLVVVVGLGLEPSIAKVLDGDDSESDQRVVLFGDLAAKAGHIAPQCDHDHDHGEAGCDHDHGPVDPHLWLDPVLASELVQQVHDELVGLLEARGDHEGVERVGEAAKTLRTKIQNVHLAYSMWANSLNQRTIVVAHDAYGYLAKRYSLETVSLSGLNASEPRPQSIASAIRLVNARKLPVIYLEPQMSRRSGELVARRTGAELNTLDPLGDGDWLKMMRENLEALRAGLSE